MKTTRHQVNLSCTREELQALFDVANAEDVEKGGRYDARGGVINVWSHHWMHPATRQESEIIGTYDVNWVEYTIRMIACVEGFALADLLMELSDLERKALGRIKHGKEA